ncbi:MAG: right-handed parallel beta-helix repeat-containing protein [Candidatus Bathyarchaeota archaeon]|nr:right-handed parallel beta-helix repeat-containing protein [Candidatus Bathyarchaeota archaeon]
MKKLAPAVTILTVILLVPMIFLSVDCVVNARIEDENVIEEDGAVSGTGNIQRDGDFYTFTADIVGSLTVKKDNVVIDGAGFTLEGDNRGVVLEGRQNVTVKNLRLLVEGGYVIDVREARDCVLLNNSLIGNPQPLPGFEDMPTLSGPIAINFLHSQNITVKDNFIKEFFYALSLQRSNGSTLIGNDLVDGVLGVSLEDSSECVFRDNRLSNCSFSVRAYPQYQYDNDLDASNTLNGKPIIYWRNAQDQTVPSDAAYVMLVNCTGITVQDCNPKGVVLASTTNSTIRNVTMEGRRSDGIDLLDCREIEILNNVLYDGAIAIGIESSQDITIRGNDISTFMTRGINLGNVTNTRIIGNTIFNNSYAIAPFQDSASSGTIIASNNFTDNSVALTVRGNMQVENNTFVGNAQAVLCYSGGNAITGNMFKGNERGVTLQSTGNVLRNNCFDDNKDSLPITQDNFDNDVDLSNTLNGKPICYWVNKHNQTVPQDAGFVALVNCSSITVQGLSLKDQVNGILLAFTTNSNVTGNLFAGNQNGIYLYGAPNNTFVGNNVTDNGYALYISGGYITYFGFPPMSYTPSSGNLFLCNNFAGNNETLYDLAGAYTMDSPPSENVWDDGQEGNYWSTYTGTDADGNGIGDSSYVVYARNTDNYPLIQPAPNVSPEFPTGTLLVILLAVVLVVAFICKRTLFTTTKQEGTP